MNASKSAAKHAGTPLRTDWLVSAGDHLDRVWNELHAYLYGLAEPRRLKRLRILIIGLAAVWAIFTLAGLLWKLLPQASPAGPVTDIVNPLRVNGPAASAVVDIDTLVSWNLFGAAAQAPANPEPVAPVAPELRPAPAAGNIGKNARETRLPLILQGVVASSEVDSAVAIIEYQGVQNQYPIGGKLPVGGNVTIARVLSDRVILDNGGTYELLKLFEKDKSLGEPLSPPAATTQLDQRGNADITELAETWRRRLYRDPRSMADVVNISAVREGDDLRGYRVSPGRERSHFEQLGFKDGDLVTGVNGIELTNPGKAMELYRIMRDASEANFEVQRGEKQVEIAVRLVADERR